jgi:hypothetical protein
MLNELKSASAQTVSAIFPSPAQVKVTVQQVVMAGDAIGIPNFQRGLVWGSEQKAALLESLFRGTPCGSLIIWKPLSAASEGVARNQALNDGDCPEYLVLDGQQRIATLIEILGSVVSGLGTAVDRNQTGPIGTGDEDADAFWWVLDAALTTLPGEPCFRFATERAKDLAGWSPLLPYFDSAVPVESASLRAALAFILKREFVVELLAETTERHRLADVVALYNRINQAGLRVSEEERVWARIAALAGHETVSGRIPAAWPSDWLRDMFSSVHPPAAGDRTWSRNEVLKRQRERNFGFKLFVQVASLAYSYHSGGAKAVSNAIAVAPAQTWAAHTRSGGVATALLAASDAVRAVAGALESPLHCDDLRFLPDASHLWPAFLAVIRFPSLALPWAGPVLAEIVLRSFLGKGDDPWEVIMASQDPAALLESLRVRRRIDSAVLSENLKSSQSLGDRYVLLFYWLARSRDAQDFMFSADRPLVRSAWAKLGHESSSPPPVKKKFRPEKQHLVPVKELQDSAGISMGVVDYKSRTRSHLGNGVANVTYISEAQNREGGKSVKLGEGGLMEEVLDLAGEPVENLLAHSLENLHAGPAAFKQNALKPKNDWFIEYCNTRRKSIAEGFEAFANRVADEASMCLARQPAAAQEQPMERVLRERFLELRRLPVPRGAQDALRVLLDNDRIRGKAAKWEGAALSSRLRQGGRDVATVGIYGDSKSGRPPRVCLTFWDAGIGMRAKAALPDGVAGCCWANGEWSAHLRDESSEQALKGAVNWLARELTGEDSFSDLGS